jgi:predicted dehydrogenase
MIRIGVICPSEIAFRRFLPALKNADEFKYIGVAVASPEEWFGEKLSFVGHEAIEHVLTSEKEKAQMFVETYGGKIFEGYGTLISSNEIDAIYLPLPPALHFKWAEKALLNNKHVFVEKPSTTCFKDTHRLVELAKERNLALHEDYMFVFHNQLEAINNIVSSGEIGDIRLYRITFGFPRRDAHDFRYNKALGGGALLDAGGYTMKYASALLGIKGRLIAATANYLPDFEVDMYGSATMVNDEGVVAQLAFGMDNDYKCDVEIWCSRGTLNSNRVLTAPTGFVPTCTIKKNQDYETRELPADDAFLKSIMHFGLCASDDSTRIENYDLIEHQEALVEQFKTLSNMPQ